MMAMVVRKRSQAEGKLKVWVASDHGDKGLLRGQQEYDGYGSIRHHDDKDMVYEDNVL